MIVQVDWQLRHRSFSLQNGRSSRPILKRWPLINWLTFTFLGWMLYRVLFQPHWIVSLPSSVTELMTIGELASGLTLMLVWTAVYWQQRKSTTLLPQFDLTELYSLSPSQFEEFVALLFQHKGYRVKMRGGAGDHGVDLELRQGNGKRAIVQCKRYQRAISPDVVRDLYGTMMHERVAHAFLVTTADISTATRQWAKGKPITLIDGQALARIVLALANDKVTK
jgi:HJR/Mrr/RecB family endonuclease